MPLVKMFQLFAFADYIDLVCNNENGLINMGEKLKENSTGVELTANEANMKYMEIRKATNDKLCWLGIRLLQALRRSNIYGS